MTVEPEQDKPVLDCQVVTCISPSIPVTPEQEMAPRLGRPVPEQSTAQPPDVAVVEFVSPFGVISEELLQRPRQGRPIPPAQGAARSIVKVQLPND